MLTSIKEKDFGIIDASHTLKKEKSYKFKHH